MRKIRFHNLRHKLCKPVVCKRGQPERNSGVVGAQRYFDQLKHLYTPEFHLKGCVCQRDFRRISLRLMLNVPPKISLKMSNLLMCEGRYIRLQSKKQPANPDKSRVYELLRSGAGSGGRTRTVSLPLDFEFFNPSGKYGKTMDLKKPFLPPKTPVNISIPDPKTRKSLIRQAFPGMSPSGNIF